jgi:two-component system chemotaxis sensor kinase CheA
MSNDERAHREFIAEASELVERLQAGTVRIGDERRRGRHSPAVVNEVFRLAHSLKGLAGMFGLDAISRLAHRMEALLDGLRLGRIDLDDGLVDDLHHCSDVFAGQLADFHAGRAIDNKAVDELVKRLAQRAAPRASLPPQGARTLKLAPEMLATLTEYEEHRLQENLKRGVPLFRAHAPLLLDQFEVQLQELTTRIEEHGELVASLPSADADGQRIVFDLLFAATQPVERWQASLAACGVTALERLDEGTATTASLPSPARTAAAPVPGATTATASSFLRFQVPANTAEPAAPSPFAPSPLPRETKHPSTVPMIAARGLPGSDAGLAPTAKGDDGSQAVSLRQIADTVRVDIQKLDELMGIVGELVLARGGLTRISNELKSALGFRGLAVDLQRLVRAMERRIVDLQTAIMQVRMVPLGQVFERLGVVARRTADALDKDVEVLFKGEDTELDKLIVEELVDPLMHIVRNAVDHGIEAPSMRQRAGKPLAGRIELRAFPRGNHVVIEVADDGRGIDEVAIRKTALERGVVDEDHIGQLSRRDVWNLMFLPGFSTRREVSDLSGRGVGLDVVKTNVQRVSGLIDVDSVAGQGTLFTVTLPMTLAIIQAVIVRSTERAYALPLAGVLEIVTVTPADVCTIEGREMVTLRGQTIPLLRLDRVFHPAEARRGPLQETAYVAVIGLAQHRAALLVDDVLGQQDIVIKSLGAYLQRIRGIAGATQLGDHETILVLDVGGLMEELSTYDTVAGRSLTALQELTAVDREPRA